MIDIGSMTAGEFDAMVAQCQADFWNGVESRMEQICGEPAHQKVACPYCHGTRFIRCDARSCGPGCWSCHGRGYEPCNHVGCA